MINYFTANGLGGNLSLACQFRDEFFVTYPAVEHNAMFMVRSQPLTRTSVPRAAI